MLLHEYSVHKFSWDFNDDGTYEIEDSLTEANPSYHYDNPGTPTAKLRVKDSNATTNIDYQSHEVTVHAGPDCTITLDSDAADGEICANTTPSVHTASVADAGTGATYTWTLTGCTLDTGGSTNSITWHAATPGTANINITMTEPMEIGLLSFPVSLHALL
jgi:PKD repeat protein